MTAVVHARAGVRLSSSGVLRSELRKLGSLRSTRVAAAAVVLLIASGIALRAFAYAQIADAADIGVSSAQAWRNALDVGTAVGDLAAVVFVVLAVASEYSSRAVLTTYLAAPRRLPVLAAKAVAALGSVLLLTGGGIALGVAASVPMMHAATLTGPSPDLLPAVLGALTLVLVHSVFSFAMAALTRSLAAGLAVVLLVMLVLPTAGALLGGLLGVEVVPYLLSSAAPVIAAAFSEPVPVTELVRAVAVTAAWLVIPAAAAAVALVRRDV